MVPSIASPLPVENFWLASVATASGDGVVAGGPGGRPQGRAGQVAVEGDRARRGARAVEEVPPDGRAGIVGRVDRGDDLGGEGVEAVPQRLDRARARRHDAVPGSSRRSRSRAVEPARDRRRSRCVARGNSRRCPAHEGDVHPRRRGGDRVLALASSGDGDRHEAGELLEVALPAGRAGPPREPGSLGLEARDLAVERGDLPSEGCWRVVTPLVTWAAASLWTSARFWSISWKRSVRTAACCDHGLLGALVGRVGGQVLEGVEEGVDRAPRPLSVAVDARAGRGGRATVMFSPSAAWACWRIALLGGETGGEGGLLLDHLVEHRRCGRWVTLTVRPDALRALLGLHHAQIIELGVLLRVFGIVDVGDLLLIDGDRLALRVERGRRGAEGSEEAGHGEEGLEPVQPAFCRRGGGPGRGDGDPAVRGVGLREGRGPEPAEELLLAVHACRRGAAGSSAMVRRDAVDEPVDLARSGPRAAGGPRGRRGTSDRASRSGRLARAPRRTPRPTSSRRRRQSAARPPAPGSSGWR